MSATTLHIAPDSKSLRVLNEDEIDQVAGGISYDQAYHDFQAGGAYFGYGAAMLVSGAWTGVALTPALVMNSLGTGGLIAGVPVVSGSL